jgi:hypothetical protein
MTRHRDRSQEPRATIVRYPMRLGQTESASGWYYALASDSPHLVAPPGPSSSLCDFQRMHFCERRMDALLRRHGSEALFRDDYRRAARLRQRICDKIALHHLGLVYSLYKTRATVLDASDELLNEGLKALARAIDAFDPGRGVQFINYACSVIIRAFYHRARRDGRPSPGESVDWASKASPALTGD